MRIDDDIFRPALDENLLLAGPQTATGRVVTWMFIIGSVSHLLLGDAWQGEWLMANLIYVAGLVLLAWRGAVAGWMLCAIGLLAPLLFMRDILTQSMIMLFWSLVACVGLGYDAYQRGEQDPSKRPDDGGLGEWVMLDAFRGITIATYLLAAFHKFNHDFLNPTFSCANYGLVELVDYWGFSEAIIPGWLAAAAPALVLAAEVSIPMLHLVGRRHLAWLVAVLFHIPLTLTMAPAFAYVMFAGHAAFLTSGDLRRIRDAARSKYILAAALGAVFTAASIWLHGEARDWTFVVREWWIWTLAVGLLAVFPLWSRQIWRPGDEQPASPSGRARMWAGVAIALFVLNGLTPYLGIQYQHAGAMVSNLRIDKGCWNHVVVPEQVRLTDDYIRVDEVYFGAPGRNDEYEDIVVRQLWSPPQIRQMRRNWCHPDARPFYLRGEFRGRDFLIEDLCDGKPLPFEDAGMFGVEVFGDYLRFQKNLERECPQACIH
jgi:hypothetical protein